MGLLSRAEGGTQTYLDTASRPVRQIAGRPDHQAVVSRFGRIVLAPNEGFVDKRDRRVDVKSSQQAVLPPPPTQALADRTPTATPPERASYLSALSSTDSTQRAASYGTSARNSVAASATNQDGEANKASKASSDAAPTTAEKLDMLGISVLGVKEGREVDINYLGKKIRIKKSDDNKSVSVNLSKQAANAFCNDLARNGLTLSALVDDLQAKDVKQKASAGWFGFLGFS